MERRARSSGSDSCQQQRDQTGSNDFLRQRGLEREQATSQGPHRRVDGQTQDICEAAPRSCLLKCRGRAPAFGVTGKSKEGAHFCLLRKCLLSTLTRHVLPWWLNGKESACKAGDTVSIPGSGRSPGGGNGN